MSIHALSQPVETIGDWYLPESPENKIAGSLNYSVDNIELHIQEALTPLLSAFNGGDKLAEYNVLHGITREGDAITLLDNTQIGGSISFRSGGKREPEKIRPSYLMIEAHLPHNHGYTGMRFRIPGLNAWLGNEIFKHNTVVQNDNEKPRDNFDLIEISNARKLEFRIDNISSKVSFDSRYSGNANPFSYINCKAESWVCIYPDQPKSLHWFLNQYGKIFDFLTMLCGYSMSADCIEMFIDDNPYNRVSLLIARKDFSYCDIDYPFKFFVTSESIYKYMDTYINNWFSFYDSLATPISLAINTFCSDKMWINIEFLSLTQSLEGFHRATHSGKYLNERDYDDVKTKLLMSLPDYLETSHRNSLKSRIGYGNEFSLRKRLNELSNLLIKDIRCTIFNNDGDIPSRWVDTRNYFTHWDDSLKDSVLEGQDLYYAVIRMRIFLRVLYLYKIGIPQDAILEMLKSNTCEITRRLAWINNLNTES